MSRVWRAVSAQTSWSLAQNSKFTNLEYNLQKSCQRMSTRFSWTFPNLLFSHYFIVQTPFFYCTTGRVTKAWHIKIFTFEFLWSYISAYENWIVKNPSKLNLKCKKNTRVASDILQLSEKFEIRSNWAFDNILLSTGIKSKRDRIWIKCIVTIKFHHI